MTNPNTTPVHLASPPIAGGRSSGDIIPSRYVLMKHSQICQTCGTLHESNDLYVQMNLAPRFTKGKYITNLIPLATPPQYRLPIEVRILATKTIPFCCECAEDALLSHLPLPPQPTAAVVGSSLSPENPPKAGARTISGSTEKPKREAASAAKLADLLSQI